MFKVKLSSIEATTNELLQATQDIRVVKVRADASTGSLLGSAAGEWIKASTIATSRFTRRVDALESELIKATDAYVDAHRELTALGKQQRSVFSSFGVSALPTSNIVYDDNVNVHSQYQSCNQSTSELLARIRNAQSSLNGLEGSGSIGTHLSALEQSVSRQNLRLQDTNNALRTYQNKIKEFESAYTSKIGSELFQGRGIAEKVKDFFSDWESVNSAIANGVTYADFFSSILDKSIKVEKFEGWFSGSADFLKKSKWKEAWNELTTGIAKQESGANAKTTTESITGVSKATTRIKSAGKIFGYVGDALTAINGTIKTVSAAVEQKGDTSDKLAAGSIEAGKQAVKFAAGKVAAGIGAKAGGFVAGKMAAGIGAKAGAAIGSAACPVVGTVVGAAVGIAVGVVFTHVIDKVDELVKRPGADGKSLHDKAVGAIGNAFRATGSFITNGWKSLWGG